MLPRLRVKRHAAAVGRGLEDLGAAAAVEQHRVGAVLALDVSLPSPGSHWKTSSPAPRKATSLPCWPSTKSSPSPPSSRSMPLLPRIVSLPAPPSTVILISAARLPVAEKLSSPPLALRTRFSEVPMSIENGAGSRRSKRTRVPLAVVVKTSAPPPPLTSTVSVPAPPSLRSVSSPGFQIIRSLPLSPKTWSSASPPVRVSFSVPPNRKSKPPLPSSGVVAGLAEELVAARAAGERVVAGAAEQVGPRQRAVGLVERDRVVAALAEHLDQRGVGDGRRAAGDGDRAAVDGPAASRRLTVVSGASASADRLGVGRWDRDRVCVPSRS